MTSPQVRRWMRNLILGLLTLLWIIPNKAQAENNAGVSFQVFYDELTPYGDWVKDGRYGYMWLPSVYEDFHPYGTNGHWVMTNYGNTWVSDYDWGWATFHYGRWHFDTNYQSWAWIPDYEWGPAWVDWRSGGGYYGWAPMGPGFSINFRINIPSSYWLFVPQRRFANVNVYNYYAPRGRRVTIYNNTTIINNTVVYNNNQYYGGPARREVERVTNRSYPERRIENSNSAGRTVTSRNSVSAYRPDLQNSRSNSTAARPSRILSSGETRTQPAGTYLRGSSRTESIATRPITTPARSASTSERSATARPSENSTVEPSSRSSSRGGFETKQYSGEQTRTAIPSRSNQRTPTGTRSSETRASSPTVRTETSRENQTRSAPARSQRSVPTQPTSPASRQNAPATNSRSSSTRTESSRTQSQPPAATRTPARSSQTREAQHAPSRTTPQVKSSSGTRTAPASTSRTSSGSSRKSSRGNN